MLFNSTAFLFAFLPLVLAGFFVIGSRSREAAAWWLAIASLVFYAGWSWRYVPLLLGSIGFNFLVAVAIARLSGKASSRRATAILIIGVAANLGLLGYFKYADFLIENWNQVFAEQVATLQIILPLGISFFTFTQIAYLVDTHRREAFEPRFSHYLLFVTYFPHLIAGPVLHHKEMMPQFSDEQTYRFQWENIAVGMTIFLIGLFKKTVLADGVSEHVGSAFSAAELGQPVHFLKAWGSALAFTMQLYFDFSGYSDMAIGLSRLFGIKLPLNFDSPYKSRNISEFWRKWHMTLSRFLRDYLYIPMGGNRKGISRRYLNLLLTMLLGGIWHGASWTFAIWGMLHGFYLVINLGFQSICRHKASASIPPWLSTAASVLITYLSVVIAWVFFRAETVAAAVVMTEGMLGIHGVILPDALLVRSELARSFADSAGIGSELGGGSEFVTLWSKLLILHIIAFCLPNTQQLMSRFSPALDFSDATQSAVAIRFRWYWAAMIGGLGALGLLAMTRHSEFLYYQF